MVLRAVVCVGGAGVDELQIRGHDIREGHPFCETPAHLHFETLTHAAEP